MERGRVSYTLYAHQKKILELLTENDRFLLLAEQGTGKTLPTVIHLSNLFLGGEAENALIVAPLSGLGAWHRDISKLSSDRRRVLKDKITFINYDKLSREGSKYQKMCWRDWDCVILDEGHAIAKPDSNRTQYFIGRASMLGLAARAKYRYLLTGTLITNGKLEDLWSPLRFILDDDWMDYRDFKAHYLVTKPILGTYRDFVVGYRHREELLALVAKHSYRVLKSDCLDLPEELPDEIVYVPFSDKKNPAPFNVCTKDLYITALESYVEALNMVMDNPLVRMTRLRQIAAGHLKESDLIDNNGKKVKGAVYRLNSNKIKYALELIENTLPHKTVVFYEYTETCHALEEALTKAKIAHVSLNGAQKNKRIWEDFQADENIKVIVVQYQTGASAIDLFAASHTIYIEPTNKSLMLEQSRARTHRSGQLWPCNYTFLLTEDTIEVDIYNTVAKHVDFEEEAYREMALARLRQLKGNR